jgi:cardiolipin synthase A/B
MVPPWVPDLYLVYLIFEWLVRIVMLVAVPMRRSAAASRSWLLLILFLPVPGLLLYLAIGQRRFPPWRGLRFQHLRPFLDELSERLCLAAPPVLSSDEAAIPALVRKLGHMPAVGGNSVEFLDDYDAAVTRLVADIDAARRHVRILVYIFADDATGRRVIDALANAVLRGVACHVLLDPVGSKPWLRGSLRALRAAGVDVREALPVRLLRGRTRRDMRNHRKLFVIDGAIGYAGSQNIVAKDFRSHITNRELLVRTTGPVVAEMSAVFITDWFMETEAMLETRFELPPATGHAVAQLLPSGADYELQGFETLLIWQIHAARERVTIVTPYLIPDEDLIGAMRTAALRGVRIDLIVSAVVDQPLVNLAQRSYYEDLLSAGIHVHRFRDFLLHAKNVSIDGKLGIVGSSNVDIRSFQLNEEVSLLLLDADCVAGLERCQKRCLAASDELVLDTWLQRPRTRRLLENLARLVSPLL